MRTLLVAPALVVLLGCGGDPSPGDNAPVPDAPSGSEPDAAIDPSRCAAGKAGAACVLALHDRAASGCATDDVAALREELELRANTGPLWANGRALFRTDGPRDIAGAFNNWTPGALRSSTFCNTDLVLAVGDVPSGAWPYKLIAGDVWTLDPANPAFVYDDFGGNADGMNSALVTPDSGKGQLVRFPEACSAALGNCREVTAYLPPGYDGLDAVDQTYPVLFMHDGQNVWDDHDCCFGHTGWELNVALDTEIGAGRVKPIVVIAAGHTPDRIDEYGLSPSKMATFMEFQVTQLQPAALARVRWDGQRVAVGGSSLGGLLSMHLALAHPTTYATAISLSGAFWPGKGEGWALIERLPGYGKQPVGIYVDHGGNVASNTDGAADSVEVRDALVAMGWARSDSPSCGPGDDALCYHAEPGATHDELAWKARTWRFLRFAFPR